MIGQKTGGRQKGTPNKITAEIREFLASLVFDNMDLIRQDVKDMTPEQRAVFLPKILPYIAPKVKTVSETEEKNQASLDLQSISNTAQAIVSWEREQEKEERERTKAEEKTDKEKATPSPHPVLQTTTESHPVKKSQVTDEELHEFMTLLCKDLEPYLHYNSLKEVDFDAIRRHKDANTAQCISSPLPSPE